MTETPTFHEITHERVKATIWHEECAGIICFNVAFSKLLKGPERWYDGAFFQREDMVALGKVADAVRSWIGEQTLKLKQDDGSGANPLAANE